MRISQEIRIIDLLAHRDAEFLRVRECEDKIREILGGEAFPFPAPETPLPSATRRGKPFRPTGILPAAAPKKPDRSRIAPAPQDVCALVVSPLDGTRENAYRIVFLDKGETKTSFLQNPQQIQQMMALACDSFRVTSIETVAFRTQDDYDTLRRLL